MQQRNLAGVTARVAGGGPRLWLLHSLLADAGSCLPLAERLAPYFAVVVPDLPGFGGTPAAPGEGLVPSADVLAAAIAANGAPATLLGNGYGSFLSLMVALRHPALVQRLVLIGTGAAFSEPGRAAFRGMAKAAAEHGLQQIAPVAMRRLFAPDFQEVNPALVAERRERFLATDPAVFDNACAALAAMDLRAEVPRLPQPALVMAGSRDEATPWELAEELAGLLPNAQFCRLEGLAHVPQLQDPDGVATLVRSFCQ